MTETQFTPEKGDADIAAYENVDLTQLNSGGNDAPPTEKKLENILIRVVFFSRIAAWISIVLLILVALYGWTRNQKQDSWLMSLEMNTAGSVICNWMNHGYATGLRNDTAFRDFLTAKGKQSFLETSDRGHCIAIDTLAEWLKLQKTFGAEELAKAYESIMPKKFLGTTITTSPELDVIAKNSPEHRMQHDVIIQLLSDTSLKLNDATSRIICHEIRFSELAADAYCEVTTRTPVQPRAKALTFMKELAATKSVLVTYPNSLDMNIDTKTGLLKTNFTVKLTYIPSRYEANTIRKLTYDKR
ncbi:hypothetical protein KBB89_01960 [Candidatus Gracilibacteria bacterium]|nr:hypothetical protein [Candidatus Gracilibacteria bacterium]